MILKQFFRFILIAISFALMMMCSKPKIGFLEITYELNEITEMEPSYQIAVWLEDENHAYVRSLFVSEYLSYGGYNLKEICSDWNKKVDWETVAENVDNFQFSYLDAEGNLLAFPIADLSEIGIVQIFMTIEQPAGLAGPVSRTLSRRILCRNLDF